MKLKSILDWFFGKFPSGGQNVARAYDEVLQKNKECIVLLKKSLVQLMLIEKQSVQELNLISSQIIKLTQKKEAAALAVQNRVDELSNKTLENDEIFLNYKRHFVEISSLLDDKFDKQEIKEAKLAERRDRIKTIHSELFRLQQQRELLKQEKKEVLAEISVMRHAEFNSDLNSENLDSLVSDLRVLRSTMKAKSDFYLSLNSNMVEDEDVYLDFYKNSKGEQELDKSIEWKIPE